MKEKTSQKSIKYLYINFLYSIKLSGKTLKLDNIEVDKKEFHTSKQAIDLNLVGITKIVISEKFKHSDKGFKYFTGNKDDNICLR